MCLGLGSTLDSLTPGGGPPATPNPSAVGGDYAQLLAGYQAQVPGLYMQQVQFDPKYTNLALSNTAQSVFGSGLTPGLTKDFGGTTQGAGSVLAGANSFSRGANVGDVSALGPAAANAVAGINPQQSALIQQLGQTAGTQLDAGTQLLPSDVNRITQGVRGDWASRGLGASAPSQLDEALQLEGSGQQLLAQREAAAGQAANAEQLITGPALGLLTGQSQAPMFGQSLLGAGMGLGERAGANLTSPAQSYDIFNTAYNARAAANIAAANNAAALDAY